MQSKFLETFACHLGATVAVWQNVATEVLHYTSLNYYLLFASSFHVDDKVAKELNTLANNERLNVTTRSSLMDFVKNYSAVQDHLDIKVESFRLKAGKF